MNVKFSNIWLLFICILLSSQLYANDSDTLKLIKKNGKDSVFLLKDQTIKFKANSIYYKSVIDHVRGDEIVVIQGNTVHSFKLEDIKFIRPLSESKGKRMAGSVFVGAGKILGYTGLVGVFGGTMVAAQGDGAGFLVIFTPIVFIGYGLYRLGGAIKGRNYHYRRWEFVNPHA